MTVRIFGPLDIDGLILSPRERTVLAALIVTRTGPVSPDQIADACWGDDPPPTWRQQVHNAVARVRSRIGADAIRTVGADYVLGIDRASIDTTRFEAAITEARAHGLRGAHDRAVAAYRRALDLWTGEPFADVSSWPPAHAEALRLHELRASAQEEMLDARLRSGEHRSVIADAELLVREAPLREQRWAVLALANYRADRQAEALAVLRAARQHLADELAVDPGRALRELETAILQHAPQLEAPAYTRPSSRSSPCPYRGLAAFEVEDASQFFGREADVDTLVERCTPGALVAVVGPSGSGKSSLVRAGLTPRLRDRGRSVQIVTPDLDGDGALAGFASDNGVLVFDQGEEMRAASAETISRWAVRASQWMADGGCLVLTLRSDFLDRATAVPGIGPEIGRGTYALSPLGPDELRRAITEPATTAGLTIEPGLEEVILHDAGDRPGILPALSHALVETWKRREGATLTISGYEAAGGIAGAIAASAEEVYRTLSEGGRDACRTLMMRMIERTPDAATVRRRVSIDTLTEDATRRSVVEGLVAARLVTIDGDAATIAHEAVGHTWPRLDAWLAEDEADARMLHQIEAAAAAWQAAGRPADDLLRGPRLHAAAHWRDTGAADLTGIEATYLDASLEQQRAESRELEARAARDRTTNRRLRVALVAAALLLVGVVAVSAVAVARSNQVAALAENARINALIDAASVLADRDPAVAALIATEAHVLWPGDPRTRQSLIATLASTRVERTILFPEAAAISGEVIPGTDRAFVVVDSVEGDDLMTSARAHIVDLQSGEIGEPVAAEIPDLDSRLIRTVDVSPTGETALVVTGALRQEGDLSSCCMNLLSGVDLTTGEPAFDTVELDRRTGGQVAFSPDGASAYLMHPFELTPLKVDLSNGAVMAIDEPQPEEHLNRNHIAGGIAVVGEDVYVGDLDNVRVFAASTLEHTRDIALPRNGLSDTLLTPVDDERLLLFGSQGAGLLDLNTGDVLWEVLSDTVSCPFPGAVTERSFFCTTSSTEVREFHLDDGQPTGRAGSRLNAEAMTVDLVGDGDHIAVFSGYESPAIVRWRTRGVTDYAKMTDAELFDAACAVAGRSLTEQEWSRYLGDEPYAPLCTDTPS